MSALQQKLDAMRAASSKKVPEAARRIMHHATDALRSSGIMDRLPRLGDPLASFTLPDENGVAVSLPSLLEDGPLVLSFYRGHW